MKRIQRREEKPDDIMEDETEGFVENDYEDEEQANFGFGLYNMQEVRDIDIDYGELDELQSLDSEKDEGATYRKTGWTDEFNPLTDM